jgi:hypothetical protein
MGDPKTKCFQEDLYLALRADDGERKMSYQWSSMSRSKREEKELEEACRDQTIWGSSCYL